MTEIGSLCDQVQCTQVFYIVPIFSNTNSIFEHAFFEVKMHSTVTVYISNFNILSTLNPSWVSCINNCYVLVNSTHITVIDITIPRPDMVLK